MTFQTFTDFVNQINEDLGPFCNEFQYMRKDLAHTGRTAGNSQLFGNIKEAERWAINKGGGIEIQYHIAADFDDECVRYGLGFNTQYVQFANEMSMVEYMRPFMRAFLELKTELQTDLPDYKFIYGAESELINPENGKYILWGKTQPITIQPGNTFDIADNAYQEILSDLKNQFSVYIKIFQKRNRGLKMSLLNNDLIKLLKFKMQIILQGPPGTGKTYTAKDIAEKMIFGTVSEKQNEQKQRLETSDQFKIIQFHPAYSYEDFVRAIALKPNGNNVIYETENKILADFAAKACQNWNLSNGPKEEIALEQWLDDVMEDFKNYLISRLDEEDQKIALTPKAYITRVTERSIRYDADNWDIDGGVPISDIKKMYLAGVNNRKEIEKLDTLTKTAKSLSTYWLKVLEIFKKYISDKNLKPDRLQPNTAMKNYVLIIDEINRSNLPAVLGELIYALEYRGESVETMYEFEGDKKLTLPRNLFIIGTMNTADRSVGHIDYAIRRRFAFVNIQPSSSILDEVLSEPLRTTSKKLFEKVKVLFSTDNIATDFKADDVQLGHSYFLAESEEELNLKFEYEIKPLLIEYIRDGIIRPEISVEGKLQDAENYIENELTL